MKRHKEENTPTDASGQPLTTASPSASASVTPSVKYKKNITPHVVRFEKIRLICLVLSCMSSSLTIAVKIRCYPVFNAAIQQTYPGHKLANLQWIGSLYSAMSYLLMPLICGALDISGASYRKMILIGGLLQVVGLMSSSALVNPYLLLLTDSLIVGAGSAICLSVVILAMDDCFPEEDIKLMLSTGEEMRVFDSQLRVMATTLCQGSVIGFVFMMEGYIRLFRAVNWSYFNIIMATIFGVEAILIAIFLPSNRQARGSTVWFPCFADFHSAHGKEEDSLTSSAANKWKPHFFDTLSGAKATVSLALVYLIAQFLNQLISNCLLLIFVEDIYRMYSLWHDHPHIYKTPSPVMSGYIFSIGQTILYLAGAVLGNRFRGQLIKVHATALLLLSVLLTVWELTRFIPSNKVSLAYIIVEIIVFFVGGCSGLVTAFAFAASQEATNIPARQIFPCTRMAGGFSFILGIHVFRLIHYSHVPLFMLSLLTAINFNGYIFILYKLHKKNEAMLRSTYGIPKKNEVRVVSKVEPLDPDSPPHVIESVNQ